MLFFILTLLPYNTARNRTTGRARFGLPDSGDFVLKTLFKNALAGQDWRGSAGETKPC
jgi:hypothetical protein